MGILNATPDSFSDGGRHLDPQPAADAAERMAADGADLLDVGGESTRPGAASVTESEQIVRVVPVIEVVRSRGIGLPITVDTTRAAVAEAALDAGADAINDVSAGTDDERMLKLASDRGCGIVLMHRLRPPELDSYSDRYAEAPAYGDVVDAVREALRERRDTAVAAGVELDRIVLDPGLGFGKSVGDNLALVRRSAELLDLGCPLLGGASRKSFVGRVSVPEGVEPPPATDRLGGSIAFSLAQLARGVRIFRVHDVREQAAALRAAWRIAGSE